MTTASCRGARFLAPYSHSSRHQLHELIRQVCYALVALPRRCGIAVALQCRKIALSVLHLLPMQARADMTWTL